MTAFYDELMQRNSDFEEVFSVTSIPVIQKQLST